MTHDRLAENLSSSATAIRHSPSAIRHLPSAICHPPFQTHSLPFSFSPTHAMYALELNFRRVLS